MSPKTISHGSTTNACAACRYQRRKCQKGCVLAPYFPKERPKEFMNAHRLFGVANITKMIQEAEESQRDTLAENLIYHANVRAADPVGGLYRMVMCLKQRIQYCLAEYTSINQQLIMYRSLVQQQHQRQRQDLPLECHSYGDLLNQREMQQQLHQELLQRQQLQQQSQLNYQMYSQMLQQSKNVKHEELDNFLGQLLSSLN